MMHRHSKVPTLKQRAAGVLLHPTSLPSRFGIGDLGPCAYRFVDFLEQAGQRWWQVLPIGPTGIGNSPYQPFSSMAGNPLLISLEMLRDEGLLTPEDLEDYPVLSEKAVEYYRVGRAKHKLLDIAFGRFRETLKNNEAFAFFEQANRDWLNDYALYTALQKVHRGHSWTSWHRPLRTREKAALKQVRSDLHDSWLYQKFIQFQFERQWKALRLYAANKGIGIIGDLPIYVSLDSADVWSHPENFRLNKDGTPSVVAGVPPDIFSKTGQRWGNPLYDWESLKERRYSWWVERLERLFALFDVIRLDHFIGFQRYWEIPAQEKTAVKGRYVPGPGAEFFKSMLKQIPDASFIAEDLGIVTPEVKQLREQFHFPGMNVLQFAFSGDPEENPYLPEKYVPESIVYTGTHDNDTTVGWYENGTTNAERQAMKGYIKTSAPINWEMIRLAFESISNVAIVPMQDVLGLGSEARMNLPGKTDGNWQWRMDKKAISDVVTAHLRQLTMDSARGAKVVSAVSGSRE
jgi:4-alpha-glucanotransferase